MSSNVGAHKLSGFPRPGSPIEMPLIEYLPSEELDSVSPLVLWSIFDADNIEFYPRHWIGLWAEEEDSLLSRVLRIFHWVTQRRYLARSNLLQVVLSIYVVMVCW